MRFVVVVSVLFVGAAVSSPILSNKPTNNTEVEDEQDWHLVPDGDGKLHIVNIHDGNDIDIEPNFVAFDQVVFRLFTRNNPTNAQTITIFNDAQLTNSFFLPSRQTRFTIHGWNFGGPMAGAFLRSAWLDRGDFNVFTVDWGTGAITPNYALARGRVNAVGAVVAQFIDWLNIRGVPFANILVSGHSLGAHCAGAAGKRVTRGTLAAIVAIDPAGPLFSIDNPQDRVHHTDAVYVESILTDIDQLAFSMPIAHASFYPNWGTSQPGCEGMDVGGFCSHMLANDFYVESINPANVFGATRCRDFNDIRTRNCVSSGQSRRLGGEPVFDGPSVPGSVFFLTTHAARPFAQGPR
ncbi:lipase member H-like [Bradysia coprophila]|uniref:lipase member H-like n=1 Tax=Bradysia coprophila TaxID=38358 RepID=UPI00187D9E46|nr:lipase member H-like [Bradysia coprophila]